MFIGMAINGASGFSFRAGNEAIKLRLHNGQAADDVITCLVEYRWYKIEHSGGSMEIYSIFDTETKEMIWETEEK